MTLVNIVLKNAAGEYGPDDRVVFHAPQHREGTGGQTINTAPKTVALVKGVGSVELDPGPVTVTLRTKGWEDTAPKTVMVPETGPVTLTDLLQQAFIYTPAVVNESLTQITTARDDALADVNGAVDQALAGSQHYSGTGLPEGKVSAPVGSVYTDTAATAGAVRWIKNYGTGATGWTVIYGDTGWRDITSLYVGPSPLTLGTGAKIMIRRKNDDVLLRLTGPLTANASWGNIAQLISGWNPPVDTIVPLTATSAIRHSTYWISMEGLTSGAQIVPSGRSAEARWGARPGTWPTPLPGTPA